MDTISKTRRSANMAAIRSKNTRPEVAVRKFLFRHGLRFRLHSKSLPGKPDIVLPGRRIAVFVHGCFWHGCKKCIDGKRAVKSNSEYWTNKILGNRARDVRHKRALTKAGWRPLTVWECEVTNDKALSRLLRMIQRDRTLGHYDSRDSSSRAYEPRRSK
jgi:DNA mismatch endonuclease (patch repair protein)